MLATARHSSDPEQLTDGVFRLRLGRTNAYIITLTSRSALLVDTGLPIHAQQILRTLQTLGLAPEQVERILLTHRHLDHAGSARALSEACNAPVITHRADAAAVQGHEPLSPARGLLGRALTPLVAFSDQRLFRYQPCSVEAVDDGWSWGEVTLLHLPGHTPGHSGYYHRPSGVVFCGDAAGNQAGQLHHPSRLFSLDPARVRGSQKRLAVLNAELYCFGHGRPLRRGSAELLSLSRR